MANRELPYESTYVNVVNFLIFDITLISLVYYFTTDVMGRFNDADLSSGERRRLFLTDYPLIGGGLCSTRRFRAALLLLARVVGLSLILATNLTIEGETKRVSKTTTATLVAQGDISNYTREQMLEALFMRSGCQSSRQYQISPSDPENHTVLFYGEIRDQKCEVDQPDLFENAVKFSAKLVRENITVGNCPRREVRNYSDVRTAVFHCDNGIVQCLFLSEIPQRVDLASCRAWYEYKNIQYISGEGAAWPLMPEEPTDARKFERLNVSSEAWLPLWGSGLYGTAIEGVHMVYGSGQEANKTVKVYENKNVTVIKPFWFAALGLKLLLVIILAVTSLILWNMGYSPVAHDEMRLAELLRRRIEENDPRLTVLSRDATPSIYLNADAPSQDLSGNSASGRGRVRVYAAGRPGASQDQPGISGSVNQSDPNYQRHADEAAFY